MPSGACGSCGDSSRMFFPSDKARVYPVVRYTGWPRIAGLKNLIRGIRTKGAAAGPRLRATGHIRRMV
jgi:hypothetical protein